MMKAFFKFSYYEQLFKRLHKASAKVRFFSGYATFFHSFFKN